MPNSMKITKELPPFYFILLMYVAHAIAILLWFDNTLIGIKTQIYAPLKYYPLSLTTAWIKGVSVCAAAAGMIAEDFCTVPMLWRWDHGDPRQPCMWPESLGGALSDKPACQDPTWPRGKTRPSTSFFWCMLHMQSPSYCGCVSTLSSTDILGDVIWISISVSGMERTMNCCCQLSGSLGDSTEGRNKDPSPVHICE